jgi:SAM-dependent methyltransferase
MKLSDLVTFLNYLDSVDADQCYSASIMPFEEVTTSVRNNESLNYSVKEPILHNFDDLKHHLCRFRDNVAQLRKNVLAQMAPIEQAYLETSTEIFNTAFRFDSVEHVANRVIPLSVQTEHILKQKVKIYTTWQHPGLILHPTHLTCFGDTVALDPMYVADTHNELLTTFLQGFNQLYRGRVRNYVLDEHSGNKIFDQLPKEQYALVVAQNYLNFRPLEVIYQYLEEIYDLLRPGGAFLFTYNNCDYAGAVRLVENHSACYTPGRLIKEHIAKLGYNIVSEYNEPSGLGFLELVKAGEKPSIRGGQTLAVVSPDSVATTTLYDQPATEIKKPDKKLSRSVATGLSKKSTLPNNIADLITPMYTRAEQQRIQLSAVLLDIDNEENIINNYSIEKLERLVNDRLNIPGFNKEKFSKRLDKLIQQRNTI